jgi:putative N6-adenine-specific DNA methylase
MSEPVIHSFVAKTQFGLEEILAEELLALGATDIALSKRAVDFSGTNEVMYKANLWCRTALRILKPIKTFPCKDEHQLYEEVQKINWEEYLSVDDTLAINAVTNLSHITHSQYASLKTKDAIVDQFRTKFDKRPSVDLDHPTLRIHVYIIMDECTISLDSSGESLHKRGYRDFGNEAPMNEVLAAGLVMMSGWNRKSNFVDFMCGSGTLLIEAGLMARNIAPGIFRKEYGFEKWEDFDADLWRNIVEDAFAAQIKNLDFKIAGCDISRNLDRIAQVNIDNAGLTDDIDIYQMPFDEFIVPEGGGTAIINPPYGERMEPADINALYKSIGDEWKKKYTGYTAWMLTSNMDAAKSIGLRPSRKIPMMNSQLECKFLKFEMYSGTKKIHKLLGKDDL